MGTELLPSHIHELYEVHEWRHACAVLKTDFRAEWDDIIDVLTNFRLKCSFVIYGGGNKSKVSEAIDSAFYGKEPPWTEKMFDTKIVVDNVPMQSPTHSVDCFRNGVALEVEWNNKDPFFDRDLNNFRLLFDLRVANVGIIITRCDELQDIMDHLERGDSFGESTTHMHKLLPKIEGGGGGGCPILVFGIRKKLYEQDIPEEKVNEIIAERRLAKDLINQKKLEKQAARQAKREAEKAEKDAKKAALKAEKDAKKAALKAEKAAQKAALKAAKDAAKLPTPPNE